tara:strand:- start:74 stop:454 length:381 start_codon:yes stop_codon:yes gene_type:complete
MGEVIRLMPDGECFLMHKDGWEKGTKVKGEWEGEYESLLARKEGTLYRKGTCSNGELNGKTFESLSMLKEDMGDQYTITLDGYYINGKKEGPFIEVTKYYQTQCLEYFSVLYEEGNEVSRNQIENH